MALSHEWKLVREEAVRTGNNEVLTHHEEMFVAKISLCHRMLCGNFAKCVVVVDRLT